MPKHEEMGKFFMQLLQILHSEAGILVLFLQALKPFNLFLPFPTSYSQNLNSAISHFPQRQQQMLLSHTALLQSEKKKPPKKVMNLSTFLLMGGKKYQIICLPLSFH